MDCASVHGPLINLGNGRYNGTSLQSFLDECKCSVGALLKDNRVQLSTEVNSLRIVKQNHPSCH